MSTSSLTAKYRPQTFADVAGQGAVKAILSRAAEQNKVAPAYLFSGTRGVGKTTIARIFAKALNCETAPTGEPCNQCVHCRQITAGVAPDVIEIDGASNRGIEDARRLKEDIGYAPLESRYKVFIIDEAHMLTREAFNALLKTLEEPPPRVTFIMATTEAHKFPATIISRCQHYSFKMLPQQELMDHLAAILDREEVTYEPGALAIIAKRGAGSVRDSMSLLGQALAFAPENLTEQDVRSFLGLAGQDVFFSLMEAIHSRDLVLVGKTLRDILDQGVDLGFFLREFTNCWRNMFLLRQAGDSALELLDLSGEEARTWMDWAGKFPPVHIHACWQMALEGQRKVMTSMEPATALELLLYNIASMQDLLHLEQAAAGGQVPPRGGAGQQGGAPTGGPASGQSGGPAGAAPHDQGGTQGRAHGADPAESGAHAQGQQKPAPPRPMDEPPSAGPRAPFGPDEAKKTPSAASSATGTQEGDGAGQGNSPTVQAASAASMSPQSSSPADGGGTDGADASDPATSDPNTPGAYTSGPAESGPLGATPSLHGHESPTPDATPDRPGYGSGGTDGGHAHSPAPNGSGIHQEAQPSPQTHRPQQPSEEPPAHLQDGPPPISEDPGFYNGYEHRPDTLEYADEMNGDENGARRSRPAGPRDGRGFLRFVKSMNGSGDKLYHPLSHADSVDLLGDTLVITCGKKFLKERLEKAEPLQALTRFAGDYFGPETGVRLVLSEEAANRKTPDQLRAEVEATEAVRLAKEMFNAKLLDVEPR